MVEVCHCTGYSDCTHLSGYYSDFQDSSHIHSSRYVDFSWFSSFAQDCIPWSIWIEFAAKRKTNFDLKIY